jgi:hypothetical protein
MVWIQLSTWSNPGRVLTLTRAPLLSGRVADALRRTHQALEMGRARKQRRPMPSGLGGCMMPVWLEQVEVEPGRRAG